MFAEVVSFRRVARSLVDGKGKARVECAEYNWNDDVEVIRQDDGFVVFHDDGDE